MNINVVLLPMPFLSYLSYVACRPRIKIPAFVIMPIAHLVEWIYRLLGPYGMKVPQLIPSRVRLLSCSRSFDCSKAKDRLSYVPVITLQVLTFWKSICTLYLIYTDITPLNCVESWDAQLLIIIKFSKKLHWSWSFHAWNMWQHRCSCFDRKNDEKSTNPNPTELLILWS